jgi:hypothetical protein
MNPSLTPEDLPEYKAYRSHAGGCSLDLFKGPHCLDPTERAHVPLEGRMADIPGFLAVERNQVVCDVTLAREVGFFLQCLEFAVPKIDSF